ncbi:MAG: mechanosensitive ion channel family protein [Thermoprotei archaeon]|nr:MAG: mechanosensitive ion channel family protein [Thermoprotei archaeon]
MAGGVKRNVVYLILLIIGYVGCSIIIGELSWIIPKDYKVYIDYGLILGFGYLIISSIAGIIYWIIRVEYGHPAAVALRSIVRVLGLGALVAMVVGALSSPGAGLALGGFMGMVVGFASQKIMSQILSGMMILLIRPFMIDDRVEVAGVKGMVEDVSLLFTTLRTDDNKLILLPNNNVLGSKIVKYPRKIGGG